MNRISLAKFSLLFALAPLSAYCAEAPLLCALNQAIECGAETGCVNRSVESVNLPPFVHVDLEKKQISAFGNSETQQTTVIEKVAPFAGKVILQGAEKGRGWSIDMAKDSGKFTAAIADDRAGFVIFGTCIHP